MRSSTSRSMSPSTATRCPSASCARSSTAPTAWRWCAAGGSRSIASGCARCSSAGRPSKRAHAAGGLSVVEGLRLLAGAEIADTGADAPAGDVAEWSRVVAGESLAKALAGLRSPEALADLDPGPGLRAELRPYQKVGLRWLWWLRSLGLGGCLADDMGLGKTVQVIALLVLLSRRKRGAASEPSLLVVPASLIANWCAEIARFAPSLRVFVAHPSEVSSAELASLSAEAVADTDVVITTYGTLQRSHGPRVSDLERRRPRRGASHQEPRRQADAGGEVVARAPPPGADGHARREPIGRSVVAVRLHLSGTARLAQGLRPVRQVGGQAGSRRLRSVTRAGPPLHSSPAQERQAGDRGSARTRRRCARSAA